MKSKVIVNRKRARQLSAFDDLQWGKCRPTDIDFSVDFQGKAFVFGELKGIGAGLTVGQRIHLTGLVDGLRAGGRTAYAFVALHDTADPEHDIHVAEATVDMVYDGESWTQPVVKLTVAEFVQSVYNTHTESKESSNV